MLILMLATGIGGPLLLGQAPLAWTPLDNGTTTLPPVTTGENVPTVNIRKPTGGTPNPNTGQYSYSFIRSWGGGNNTPPPTITIGPTNANSPYAFRILFGGAFSLGAAGTQTLTMTVTDFSTPPATLSVVLTMEVLPGFGITSPPVSTLTARNGYVFGPLQVAAVGGTAPYTFWLTGNDWVTLGIELVGDTLVSNGPIDAIEGEYYSECTLRVTDALNQTTYRTYTVFVVPPMSMRPPVQHHGGSGHGAYHPPIGDWIEGVALEPIVFSWDYSEPGPMTFTLSGEPSGLMLDTATATLTGVLLTGTPTIGSAGQYTIVVRAVDSIGQVAERTLQLLIRARLSITTTAFPIVAIGENIATPITVVDGVPPYTFSASGLPRGISIAPVTGVVSGTVLEMPQSNIVISVTDSFHIPQTATMTVEFPIELMVVDSTLRAPQAVVDAPYSHAFAAMGGKNPYTWTLSGLPLGMTFDPATGTISGTPIETGYFTVRIDLVDYSTLAPQTFTTLAALNVSESGIVPPVIVSAHLPAATEGARYSSTISVTGGQPAYRFDVSGLPQGMDGSDGVIAGVPAAGSAGSYLVRIVVTDGVGQSTSAILRLVVSSADSTHPPQPGDTSPTRTALPNLVGGAAACSLVHGRASAAGVVVLLAIAIGIALWCVVRSFVAPCAFAWREASTQSVFDGRECGRHPREGGDPETTQRLDSRLRGNDVTLKRDATKTRAFSYVREGL